MKDVKQVNLYTKKLDDAQKEVALINAQLNGKYNEDLIQRRNLMSTEIDLYKKKISWYGNQNKEKIEQQLIFNIEILKP